MFGLILLVLQVALAALCIWDLVLHDLPGKILWGIVCVVMPLGSILYIILRVTAFREFGGFLETKEPELNWDSVPNNATIITDNPATAPTQSAPQEVLQVPVPPYQYSGRSASKAHTFKIIGGILAGIAIVAGLVFVGFIILFMMAISSYGSNK